MTEIPEQDATRLLDTLLAARDVLEIEILEPLVPLEDGYSS